MSDEKKQLSVIEQQIKERGDEYYKAFVLDPNNELTALPENVFVQTFLPFFCGEKKYEDNPEIVSIWIGIAGSPSKQVKVIDEQGQMLFTVPGLVDTSFINLKQEDRKLNFSGMMTNYMLYKDVLPSKGENYLNAALEERLKTLRSTSTAFIDGEKRWNEIFTRYGKGSSKEKAALKTKSTSDDDLIYE